MEKKIIVETDNKDRIDQYLSKLEDLELSRAKIQKMIKDEKILVNGLKVKNSYIPIIDDEITLLPFEEEITIKPEDIDINVVYEDNDVMVVYKPSGMVVHPSETKLSGTLVNGLMNYSKKLSSVNGEFRPGIVHRIDKDTSGLLLIAKNDKAHNSLAEQLKNKTVTRKYVALVSGIINHDTGTIDAPIGRDPKDRKKMTVTSTNSKDAITHFKVLERYKNSTLIECILETGRTHQIRVHMKYINHPVVNDPIYTKGKNIDNYGQMLHAKTIGFIHSTTKEYMEFDSDFEEEFNKILEIYKNE